MMALVSDGKPAADLCADLRRSAAPSREQAGLTRWEVAALAKLSWGTIRNIETGRTAPHPWTVRCLRAVEALRLVEPTEAGQAS
jgi:ribosome-binding protein aMBF1 (putative translation factor)